MPTMHARYGRPKGSGVDDSRQLQSLAALLAANPALKPTTAIRSLGVADPSAIRRLRDKFHADQARLMADARGISQTNGRAPASAHSSPFQPAARRPLAASERTPIPAANDVAPEGTVAATTAPTTAQPPLPAIWCDLGLWAFATAMEQQAVLARHWLRHPAFEIAMRGQLAIGAFMVAAATPRKPLKPRIH
jgi:hypothetical protein